MATVPSLPLEIIHNILSFTPQDSILRNHFLRRTSLVHRTWRLESQKLLWSEIQVVRKQSLDALLRSALLGRLQTRYLRVKGAKLSVKKVVKLVSLLVGLKKLRFMDFEWHGPLDYEIFCSPNLAGLETVELVSCILQNSNPSRHSKPPFLLTSLTMDDVALPSRFPTPYSFFSSSSLTFLSFSHFNRDYPASSHVPIDDDINNLIQSVGSQLLVLAVNIPVPDHLLPSFALCTNVERLKIGCEYTHSALNEKDTIIEILETIPLHTNLKSIRLPPLSEFEYRTKLEIITSLTDRLFGTKFIGPQHSRGAERKSLQELLDGCREVGMSVSFEPSLGCY